MVVEPDCLLVASLAKPGMVFSASKLWSLLLSFFLLVASLRSGVIQMKRAQVLDFLTSFWMMRNVFSHPHHCYQTGLCLAAALS